VEGNRSLIAQALANLVDNAIKYTPEGGAVRIRIAVTDAGVELSVADSGPGIPAEDRIRVVERFVRLEASRNSPGTGLGLSLVAAVAHFHNAQLELQDSDIPGTTSGLMAVLRFPRVALRVAPLKNAAE
jgi:signal transduction histidine kinase